MNHNTHQQPTSLFKMKLTVAVLSRYVTTTACVIALLFAAPATQAEPRFQTAENVDCKVYLNNRKTVRWYGPCVNGRAHGVGTAQYLDDQKLILTYKGGMGAGKWQGQGTTVAEKYVPETALQDTKWKCLWLSNKTIKITEESI